VTDLLDPFARPDHGALFVVSGPSGAGKTTLVHRLLARFPDIQFSVSATTRPPRSGEVDGKDYHFLTAEQFETKLAARAFLEHAHVYGNHYGTLAEPVHQSLAIGQSILLEIDSQGAMQVRAAMPEAVTIIVVPPSLEILEQRLRARSTDSPETIARRLREADEQLASIGDFHYLVVNDDLDASSETLTAVVVAELHRVSRHPGLVGQFRRD
jgi:guanylate kinase